MKLEQIAKHKPFRRANVEEVERVRALVNIPILGNEGNYNFHKVPVAGEKYLVADAKVLNKATNQKGRGNVRYLLDLVTREYQGIAIEKDNGNYRRLI